MGFASIAAVIAAVVSSVSGSRVVVSDTVVVVVVVVVVLVAVAADTVGTADVSSSRLPAAVASTDDVVSGALVEVVVRGPGPFPQTMSL